MAITISIGPDGSNRDGAGWRVLLDNGEDGPWLGSGESAELSEPGTTMTIREVRLKLKYNFCHESGGVKTVHVRTAPETEGLHPYFELPQSDVNSRTDGRGEFYRAYKGVPALQLTAQESYGKWRFDRWTDPSGKTLGETPRITLDNIDEDQELRAVYAPVGE